ncbi:MAG: TolC family protein [Rhodospirillales bacterium]|nr:TolC family protein [Rhodospirillales bacterium]
MKPAPMPIARRIATPLVLMALLLSTDARSQEAHPGAIGRNIDELIAIARSMNPEIQVMALEADAATAKAAGAGSLADPKIQFAVEDWRRDFPSYAPAGSTAYTTKKLRLTQELPFWGKRDLKREIAEAGAKKAAILKRAVENDLMAKLKVAYAEYHQAHQAIDLAKNLRGRMEILSRLAGLRYAQGLGRQQDVTRAEVEKAMIDAEIARMEAERQKARVRVNRLLSRELSAPLVETLSARPIPPKAALDLPVLVDRAQTGNPEQLAQDAIIEGADRTVSLAEKGWYPDFEVGVGTVRKEGRWDSYEAMVSLNIPLQWGLRNAEIGEAKAMAAAARQKRKARENELGGEVQEAYFALESARRIETLLRENSLPQAEIGFQAAAKSYELGRTEFLDVLMAEQQLWKTQIELLRVHLDQQMRLAEIEKLIGSEL